jgi:hypothetical protein
LKHQLNTLAPRWLSAALLLLVGGLARPVSAATLVWKGHTWQVTSGGMAGVCKGDPNNVSIDSTGYLHFKISNTGGTWTASEMFTTDNLGFGTYQWQVDGPVDTYDKNIVLGFFPYGPAAGIGADGTNEIDIEYSRWGQANGANGDWTNYPNSGTTIGELSYTFSLTSTLSTSRFIWTASSIQDFVIDGLQPVNSTTGLIKTWTYAPSNPSTNIPQRAMPLGMNLWCFNAPPSNSQPVEIVIRDFQFIAAGTSTGGAGTGGSSGVGTGGTRATGGNGGVSSTGGASAITGGTKSTGGTQSTGGATSAGGSMSGTGGAVVPTGGTRSTGVGGSISGTGGTKIGTSASPTGGSVALTGGASAAGPATGGFDSTGGADAAAGGAPAQGGGAATGGIATADSSGTLTNTGSAGSAEDAGSCSCRIPKGTRSQFGSTSRLALLGLALLGLRRRRGR